MLTRNTARAAAPEAATLQYANGRSMARFTPGTGRFVPLVGFHIEAGKDEALDRAMQATTISPIEIKHQRPGGAEIIRHWYLGERVIFHPVTAGPVATTIAASVSARFAAATAEAGLGLRWGQEERSKLAVRGYVAALLEAGYDGLVQLAVRSRMTDVLLACLLDHGRVCEAADALVDRVRHPDVVLFHEIGLPLVPGEEAEWGRGETASVVPFRSDHPEAIDAEYLRTRWRTEPMHDLALAEWAAVQAWAAEYAAGHEEGQEGPAAPAAPMMVEEASFLPDAPPSGAARAAMDMGAGAGRRGGR